MKSVQCSGCKATLEIDKDGIGYCKYCGKKTMLKEQVELVGLDGINDYVSSLNEKRKKEFEQELKEILPEQMNEQYVKERYISLKDSNRTHDKVCEYLENNLREQKTAQINAAANSDAERALANQYLTDYMDKYRELVWTIRRSYVKEEPALQKHKLNLAKLQQEQKRLQTSLQDINAKRPVEKRIPGISSGICGFLIIMGFVTISSKMEVSYTSSFNLGSDFMIIFICLAILAFFWVRYLKNKQEVMQYRRNVGRTNQLLAECNRNVENEQNEIQKILGRVQFTK